MRRRTSTARASALCALSVLGSGSAFAADARGWQGTVSLFSTQPSPSRLLLENQALFMGFVGSMVGWLKPPRSPQGPYVLPSVELMRAESRTLGAGSGFAYNGSVRLGVDLGYRLRRGNVEVASGVGLRQDWGFSVVGAGGASLRSLELERDAVPVALTLNVLKVTLFF